MNTRRHETKTKRGSICAIRVLVCTCALATAGLLAGLAAGLTAPGIAFAAPGDLLWTQAYNSGGTKSDYGYGVAVDSGNNVYITGQKDTVGIDMFLLKYDSTGAFQWMQTYSSGGTQTDRGNGVAVDSGNNIYVTGEQETNNGDMFLRKYDSSGNFQWMQTYSSGVDTDFGLGVAVDSGNNIYVTGEDGRSDGDMFLRKYNSAGTFQWMQTYNSGGINWDAGYAVAVDSASNIYVTGFQATNGSDMFLRKYNSTGTFQWMQTYNSGGTQADFGNAVAVDSANNINIAGSQQTNGYDAVVWQYDGGGGSGGGGVDCGLRAYDGASTVTIDCEDPAVSPLRVQKGATTYGISVVDPADPSASRIRIQTPSGVKALRKQ